MRPDSPPVALPRKKPSILWWIGGGSLLLFLGFLYQEFGPSPRIVISKQTTYITEPLGPDGLPDYEKYVLERYREGLTPENNAAILVMQAMWPPEMIRAEDESLIATELGLDAKSFDREKIIDERLSRKRVSDWQISLLPATIATATVVNAAGENQQDADGAELGFAYVDPAIENAFGPGSTFVIEILGRAGERPWTSEQIPPLAKWIHNNQRGIDLLVEASRRPRFYAPSATLLDDEHEHGSLAAILMHGLQDSREAVRCLSVRAMWHTGEGRFDEAYTDLRAILRLSHLVAQDQSFGGKLVAISNMGLATFATPCLLDSKGLTAEQARRILDDFTELRRAALRSTAVEFERLTLIDMLIGLAVQPENIELLKFFELEESQIAILRHTRIDWNAGLIEINKWFDRGVAADQITNRQLRRQAIEKLDADLAKAKRNYDDTMGWFNFLSSPAAKGQFVARRLLPLYLSGSLSALTIRSSHERRLTELDLLRIAAGLALFRSESASYPNKLDDLVPDVFRSLPADLYNAKAFIYKKEGDGYLLYSLGEDGIDDGGSNSQLNFLEGRSIEGTNETETAALRAKIPADADDISIRVPQPVFEMPKPPIVK